MPEFSQIAAIGIRRSTVAGFLLPALPGLVVAVALLFLLLLTVHGAALQGVLNEPDSYMQIVHFRSLLEEGGWTNGLLARDNAPYGMELHWSRAYHYLVLALAAPLAAAVGWAAAITEIGPMLGPIWTGILIIVGVWAAAPACGNGERAAVGIALAASPIALVWGVFGNADHHIAVLIAWVALMGFALRVASTGPGLGQGLGAGIAAAVALWLNADCIIPICLGLSVMGIAWIRDGERRRAANLAAATGFALTLSLALALDPPPTGWRTGALDRLSIVYVTFSLLFAGLWLAIARAPQHPAAWRGRLIVGAIAAAAAATLLAWRFPQILTPEQSVFIDIEGPTLWTAVAEMMPAFRTIENGVLFMGGPIIGMAASLWFAWRARGSRAFAGWLVFIALLAITGLAGLYRTRFAIYPEALAALPIGMMAVRAGPFVVRRFPSASRWVWGALLGGLALTAPVLAAAMLRAGDERFPAAPRNCDIHSVAAALNDPRFMGGRDHIIMAHPNDAPAVLYWTANRTVAGPYHRNRQGLADVAGFMTSHDDVAAREIAARRGIGYVLICPGRTTAWPPRRDGETLGERLEAGDVPGWLAPRPWPAGIVSDLRLFRVVAP